MPNSFFASDKKRKRPSRPGTSGGGGSSSGGASGRGRGRGGSSGGRGGRGGRSRPVSVTRDDRDEEVSSDDGGDGGDGNGPADLDMMDFREGRGEAPMSDDELIDANETAAEKRIRLAKGYLARVKEKVEAERLDDNYDAAEIDRELIASRLQQDVAEAQGRIHLFLGSHVLEPTKDFLTLPSHVPTSVAMTPTAIYVSTKRGSVQKYALPSLRKVGKPFGQARAGPSSGEAPQGHKGEILSIAASENDKWLVTAGRDKTIGVWDVSGNEPKWKTGMRGHKDAVTSVAIPPLSNPSHHILTASLSRHLAVHSLSTLSLIDTFFGHQDSIPSVSSLKPTLAVTAGSRDRTCRWWKVEDEVQLVFRGGGRSFERPAEDDAMEAAAAAPEQAKKVDRKGKGREIVEGSIDVVCMLDEQHFVSGGDSGAICLWHTGKKKPIFTLHLAHGVEPASSAESSSSGGGGGGVQGGDARWITSLAALRGTDLFVSGSWDGQVRVFALDASMRSFAQVGSIACPGVINGLQMLALPANSVDPPAWPHHAPPSPESPPAASASAPTSRSKHSKAKEIMLVAAVAREPRLGRWIRIKDSDSGVKNGCLVAHIKLDTKGQAMLA